MGLGARALRSTLLAAATLSAAAAVSGCGGSSAGDRGVKSEPGEFPGEVTQAESTFRPADFGIETWEADTSGTVSEAAPDSASAPETAAPDTIPGFRVQVAITEDIDRAMFLKDSLSAALHDEWVYVVHHAPYYKVRLGDFGERHLAAGFLDELKHRGYPDAWIVPDRVFRNPPPKPLPVSPDSSAGADTAR